MRRSSIVQVAFIITFGLLHFAHAAPFSAGGGAPSPTPVRTTRLAPSSPLPLAYRLAHDDSFETVINEALMLAFQQKTLMAQMSPGERELYVSSVRETTRRMRADGVEGMLDTLGADPDVAYEQHDTMQQLAADYRFSAYTESELDTIISDAVDQARPCGYTVDGWIEYNLHPIEDEPTPENEDCLLECKRDFVTGAAIAINAYIGALAACTMTGPAAAFCLLSATATYIYALARLEVGSDNCVEACEEEVLENWCYEDGDCAGNEYCWTGVVGIGTNECRPKKNEGRTCSRDGQCFSDCCKYHAWSHPVSKVCRPSNRCH